MLAPLTVFVSQRRGEALKVNISAGEGLQDVLKSNLGPLGTIKMYAPPLSQVSCRSKANGSRLVDGAGQVLENQTAALARQN